MQLARAAWIARKKKAPLTRRWPDMNRMHDALLLISLRHGIRVPRRRSNPRRAAPGLHVARLAALVLMLAPAVARAQSPDPSQEWRDALDGLDEESLAPFSSTESSLRRTILRLQRRSPEVTR